MIMKAKTICRELLWALLVAAATALATWIIWGAKVIAF